MSRPASPIFAAITAAKSILPVTRGDSSLDGAERRSVAPVVARSRRPFAPRASNRSTRDEPALRSGPSRKSEWSQHAIAAEAAGLIVKVGPDQQEISLLLEGIRCGACVWIIEKYLQRLPGVVDVGVNFATRRARVRWMRGTTQLAAVLQAITDIGYRALSL